MRSASSVRGHGEGLPACAWSPSGWRHHGSNAPASVALSCGRSTRSAMGLVLAIHPNVDDVESRTAGLTAGLEKAQ